ncbi:16S rRNA (uracil(1498)-N(3))-methyltransferase [Oceanobacillus halophilus]|uniref:Ribosomal RNA small subunit methyltransferase E n=1 Tax=Oceanobacillus halophilus TaxID=930130 RepID=A0A495ACY7_9BACI|nr:16S rRNA (uracil(1498)-N(3))-methyltransferase [Oceanobacillus halophilus]RKQ37831.1 16S rRNA (uracil(1498)-N(3))-methyltransferase [Oceanobacillus halophilus]
MQRYFIPASSWNENKVVIQGNDIHHITRVMRFVSGDKIICNSDTGEAALCEIIEIDHEQVVAEVLKWLDEDVELPIKVAIAQGIPKGDKLDLVLQKGTELGAQGFIPFQSKRSVVVWDNKKAEKKLKRFSKIVKEASEQSHRNKIPEVKQPMTINQLIQESLHYDMKIFAYEEEAKVKDYRTFGSILNQIDFGQKLLICVGPEGGFSSEEVNELKSNGFHAIRLGPRILRTETAALYALAAISYHFEEMET